MSQLFKIDSISLHTKDKQLSNNDVPAHHLFNINVEW